MDYQAEIKKLEGFLAALLRDVEPLPKERPLYWPNLFRKGRNGGYTETQVSEEIMQWYDDYKKRNNITSRW